MGAPGAEGGDGGEDPVAPLKGEVGGADGGYFEKAFISGDGGGFGGADEGCEGRFGAVGALNGIDVGRVDWGGEGTEEEGAGGKRRRDGMGV